VRRRRRKPHLQRFDGRCLREEKIIELVKLALNWRETYAGQGLDIGLMKFNVGFDMRCQLDPFVSVRMSKGSNQIGVSLMLGKPRQ
jgi:hypothetical protein